jgi:hypothetical protein
MLAAPVPAASLTPAVPTQVKHPWRAVIRTVFALLIGAAALAPEVVSVSHLDTVPALSGAVATLLAVSGGVTRVMALPGVNGWLSRNVPWLAASPAQPF